MGSTGRGRRGDRGSHDGERQSSGDDATRPSQQDDSPERRARDSVYQLLAVRARSRSELMRALRRKDIEEEIAEGVVQKFVDAGLVDDAAFAEHWAEARQRHRGLGRKALGFELRSKGVDEQTVAETLSNLDHDVEVERARELVRHKLPAMTAADTTTKMRRLLGMLARKGYAESLAFRVVREEVEHSEMDSPIPEDPSL